MKKMIYYIVEGAKFSIVITMLATLLFCSKTSKTIQPGEITTENKESTTGSVEMRVQDIFPKHNETSVPVNTSLFVVFTKPVDETSIAGNISITNLTSFTTSMDIEKKVLRIYPASNLNYSTNYSITVNKNIKASDSNTLDNNYAVTFTTTGDPNADPAPYIIASSRSPSADAFNVALAVGSIQLTFSEPVTNVTSSTFTVLNDAVASGSPVSSNGGSTWQLNLIALLPGKVYTVKLSADITDVSGKALVENSNATWSFTTVESPMPNPNDYSTTMITSVWITNATATTADINFSTNIPIESNYFTVNYGTTSAYGNSQAGINTGKKVTHKIQISGLAPATVYYLGISNPGATNPAYIDPLIPGRFLTFITKQNAAIYKKVSNSTINKENINLIQNTTEIGGYSPTAYIIWHEGGNIYADFLNAGNPPANPSSWTVAPDFNGTEVYSAGSASTVKTFSDDSGAGIITYEKSGSIYAKRIFNNGGALAYTDTKNISTNNWGETAAHTGIVVSTGSNVSAAKVWGSTSNNNASAGTVSNITDGTNYFFPGNVNYLYDFATDFTIGGYLAGTIVYRTNDTWATISNVTPVAFRHVIQLSSALSTGAYRIASHTTTETIIADDHIIKTTGNPVTTVDYFSPKAGSPINRIYSQPNYTLPTTPVFIDNGDIVIDNNGNSRRLNANPILVNFASTNPANPIMSGTSENSVIPTGLIDTTNNFSTVPMYSLSKNTTTIQNSYISDLINAASGILGVIPTVFSGGGENYEIYPVYLTGTAQSGTSAFTLRGTAGIFSGVSNGDHVINTTNFSVTTIINVDTPNEVTLATSGLFAVNDNFSICQQTASISGITNNLTNLLTDSGNDFTTLQIGDLVKNNTDFTSTHISSIISSHLLSLDSDIISTSGKSYDIINGKYSYNRVFTPEIFSPFYQFNLNTIINANVSSFTVYNRLLSATSIARPANPLFDNSATFTTSGVVAGDIILNYTTLNAPINPNKASVTTVYQRALQLSANNFTADGHLYNIIRLANGPVIADIIETGITTSTTSYKLNSTNCTFVASGVEKGDVVYNVTTPNYAVVRNVNSENQLTLDKDIFGATNDRFIVLASTRPILATGIVSSGGATFTDTDVASKFTQTIQIGDVVRNQTTSATSIVTSVNSDISLTLASNIMTAGDRYIIEEPRIIFTYQDSNNIYGKIVRMRDGSNVGTAFTICDTTTLLKNPKAISSGDGNVFVVWQDTANTTIYGKHLNSEGTILTGSAAGIDGIILGTGGNLIDAKKADGTNLYILYTSGGNILVSKISTALTTAWTSTAISGSEPVMTVTSDNSVVIAYTKADGKVYAAKPSSAGAAVFPLTETVICDYKSYENWKSSSESPFNSNISIVSDQFGGAIISWIDYRYYPILGNCVFAQKINSTGIRLWDASTGANDLNGVMMGVINEYAQEKYSLHSSTYNDGGVPYGLLILWKDYFASPSKADIYYNTR